MSLYSQEVLAATGRVVIQWGGWSALKKAELAERIVDELKDRVNLKRLVTKLRDPEREALRQVLAGGGYMDWQEFETRFDADLEESPYWQYHAPESVMGRLRLHGLLAEATVNDQLFVVIPVELRPVLAELLA